MKCRVQKDFLQSAWKTLIDSLKIIKWHVYHKLEIAHIRQASVIASVANAVSIKRINSELNKHILFFVFSCVVKLEHSLLSGFPSWNWLHLGLINILGTTAVIKCYKPTGFNQDKLMKNDFWSLKNRYMWTFSI